jgi:hypothetical protein
MIWHKRKSYATRVSASNFVIQSICSGGRSCLADDPTKTAVTTKMSAKDDPSQTIAPRPAARGAKIAR